MQELRRFPEARHINIIIFIANHNVQYTVSFIISIMQVVSCRQQFSNAVWIPGYIVIKYGSAFIIPCINWRLCRGKYGIIDN